MLKKRGPEKTLFKSLHTFLQAVCQARESPAVKKRGWPNEVGDHTGHCRTCWSAAKSIPRSFLEYIHIYIYRNAQVVVVPRATLLSSFG